MHEIRKAIILPNHRVKDGDLEKWEIRECLAFMEIFFFCASLNVLPKSGGLLDQDSLFIYLMRYAMSCQAERKELDDRRSARNATKRS